MGPIASRRGGGGELARGMRRISARIWGLRLVVLIWLLWRVIGLIRVFLWSRSLCS